jgi:TonB family protein
MKKRQTIGSWVVMVVLMVGCASMVPPETDVRMPELISQVPLPALSPKLQGKPLRLQLKIHVAEDGSVREAQFAESSGDPEWDHLALEKVRQWTFAPARHGDRPVSIWIRQSIVLQFTDQLVMSLAEIHCPTAGVADSLYGLLLGGADFGALARRFSVASSAPSGGVMGDVDIRTFPYAVQEQVRQLKPGEFTRPMRLGEHYVLILRQEEPVPGNGGSAGPSRHSPVAAVGQERARR